MLWVLYVRYLYESSGAKGGGWLLLSFGFGIIFSVFPLIAMYSLLFHWSDLSRKERVHFIIGIFVY